MISTKTKTIEILNKYNLNAKKRFGQNFLIDSNIVNKIIGVCEIDKETDVLEIGPGIGALTEVLIEKARKVVVCEIDKDMVEVLNGELKSDTFKIVNDDFLKVDIDSLIKDFNKPFVVVSNLPYYITTPIINKLLSHTKDIKKMVFMVQKEVASRLTALPNSKDYGSLSVLIKLNGDMRKEFIVSQNCFFPAPNVDSEIVSMIPVKNDSSLNYGPKFLKFIQNIFEMKRKTLLNNIISKYNIEKDKVLEIFNALNIKNDIRSENLDCEMIKKLYQTISIFI